MKVISDIRLYKSSETDNLLELSNKSLNLSVHRIVMKLREYGFSLGEYDHLYFNFTTLKSKGTIELNHSGDRYHPWYRYYDIGVSQNEYNNLENTDCTAFVIDKIRFVLCNLFNAKDVIDPALVEAKKGAEMLMHFKEKKSAKGIATIYLRLLDNGKYLPLLCVTDTVGNEILRADLHETIHLNIIGEIQLNSKKVTVKPRKNVFAKEFHPISFEIKL
ncbi:MAG: hypothetical protein E7480_07075 [Ruminococcaceae bacterium]|nr:hypothetical protein [Oscillospiraceae bacterium]